MSAFIVLTGIHEGSDDKPTFHRLWVRRDAITTYGDASCETAALLKFPEARSFVRTAGNGVFIVTETISQIADLLAEGITA